MSELKEQVERYKNVLGILAIVCAGIFFSVKAFDGWLNVNMDLDVMVQRKGFQQNTDVLIVLVKLAKGEHGAIKLAHGSARISFPFESKCGEQVGRLYGWERVTVGNDTSAWQPQAKLYGISPGEKLQLAGVFKVPSHAVVAVDVVVVGKPKLRFPGRHRDSQWRSATISAPDSFSTGRPTGACTKDVLASHSIVHPALTTAEDNKR